MTYNSINDFGLQQIA